ncbi:MAG: sulfatase-like hydrolase/transferase [Oscillospiraceae bacterium]|nr:sulfatase-like hydrolase/transferase [Oscillospiraceae bacterium]
MEENKKKAVSGKEYWKNWLHRFLGLLAPAFLLCFTGLFFGPLDIVNSNQAYLTFSAGTLFWSLAGVTVAVTLLLSVVLAFVPGKAQRIVYALLLGFAVLFYFQGVLLNDGLAVLDGSGFDWRDDAQAAYINIAIWAVALVVIVVAGWFLHNAYRTAGYILCAALVLAQAVSLATTWQAEDPDAINYQLAGDEEFVLSSDENIIVITLDQMSPLIFEEALEEDPTLAEFFQDFIYYDNMSTCYSFTFPSLCYLLTHEYFDTTIPTVEAVYNAWHSDLANNFYDTLHDNGYTVNLYLESNYAAIDTENMLGKVDNIAVAGDLVVTGELLEDAVYMSLYRYLPTMLKNDFYVSTGGIVDVAEYQGVEKLHINYDFYTELLEEGISLTDDTKVFSWYHLQGVHFPYVVNYEGYSCDEDETDRMSQLHGYLLAVGEFLEQMKEQGIYDDATIIISADHGYFECFQAAFLIKMPGQEFEEMQVTSAPVAQEDIMPTILYALGEDYSDYGTTVFDWEEGDVRERTTRVWGYMRSYPDVDWVGNLNQWDAQANGSYRYNVFGVFNYIGDRDTIYEEERYWYLYGVADAIEPLYDSFY